MKTNTENVAELPDLALVEHTLSNRVAKVTNLDNHISVPASWLLVLLMRGVPQDAPAIEPTNTADAAQSGDTAADVEAAPGAVAMPAEVSDPVTPTRARKRTRKV